MPMTNEHAARLRDPNDFKADSFRSKVITDGVRLIVGKLKDDDKGSMTGQSYRFKTSKFTASEAKKWLKDHNVKYIAFEPASDESKSADQDTEVSDMYIQQDIIERRCLPAAELRVSEDEDSPKIHGYAAVFNTWTDIGGVFKEKIKERAFSKTIKENDIRALINHNENLVLGRNKAKPKPTCRLREDAKGLAVEIDPPDTSTARDLMISMKRGDITQMSFAFSVNKQEIDYDRNERTLIDVTLYDVSVVTYPAYPTTSAYVRSLFQKRDQLQALIDSPELTTEEEMELIFQKIRSGEPLSIEEQRKLAAYIPDVASLTTPPAQHVETLPEPPAKHSEGEVEPREVIVVSDTKEEVIPTAQPKPPRDRVAELLKKRLELLNNSPNKGA